MNFTFRNIDSKEETTVTVPSETGLAFGYTIALVEAQDRIGGPLKLVSPKETE